MNRKSKFKSRRLTLWWYDGGRLYGGTAYDMANAQNNEYVMRVATDEPDIIFFLTTDSQDIFE